MTTSPPAPGRSRLRRVALAAAVGGALAAPAAAHAMPVCGNGDPCPSSDDTVHFVGRFNGGGQARLPVHAAPRTRSKVVRQVRSGSKALIVCQTTGGLASGPYGRNRIWDKLAHGGFISDTQVYTGSDGRVAPDCPGSAPAPTPAPGTPAGGDPFRYDDPGAWTGPSGCSGGYTPGAVALRTWLRRHYRDTSRIYGYACRQNTANGSQVSLHAEGRALDWMMNAGSASQRAIVARFVRRVAAGDWRLARAMGIQELIWNRHIWTSYHHADGWRAYTGPNPHTDHIHIGLNRPGAAKQTSFYR